MWWDNNTNQAYNPGAPDNETPIADAVVLLYYDANNNGVLDLVGQPGGDTQVGFAMTDGSGLYLFDNLAPGKYLVDVYEDSITVNGVRNVVPTTLNVQYKNLAPKEPYRDADFGYYQGAKVEGNVFWDEDHNGVLDASEQNPSHLLPNVTITLTCAGLNGILGDGDDVTQTQNTGADGHFAFLTPAGVCSVTYDQADIPAQYGDRTTPTTYTFTAMRRRGLASVVRLRRGQRRRHRRHRVQRRQ